MAEEILGDIQEVVQAAMLSNVSSRNEVEDKKKQHDGSDESGGSCGTIQGFSSNLESNLSRSFTASDVGSNSEGSTFSKVLSVAGSCSINLILPFLNGLMLGFGELLAHELSWKFSWFDRERNKGYRIYPEIRKTVALEELQRTKAIQMQQEVVNSNGFL
ncbi:Mim1p Ecym_1271 [Eremothecium cymbalariae DBVPG|uniref:Mitochondrial import protein 1 n=1 Tax=Eremothecium cymbalariae (strain CBS 270.75 / DBVPG 7215 / KCTC 17166 / NRRL Y-17582) TaxID=931890 RepID=G8JN48_ERECY|nr:hypothetical protein Ecym_1271 [Eremothecium cymbalariae DBVPG\